MLVESVLFMLLFVFIVGSILLLVWCVVYSSLVSGVGCFVGGCLGFWFWLCDSVFVVVRIGLGWGSCCGFFECC